jgi:eukaryotic-like serine/threonine-protein kinase
VPLTIGARLGPYEIVSPIGAGGMGEVYKARDTRLDRTVAIKVLPADLSSDPDLRARFEREARAIAALDHPHICAIYDVGEAASPDSPDLDGKEREAFSRASPVRFLVMQYLDGETLATRLARAKGSLPLDDALKIAIEIAGALDKAHRAGITHRDLKPANIMLTKTGAKLLDFGLAKLRGPAAPISMSGMTRMATADTARGTILGTVHYMAPEQLEGKEADARSDIWALGVVLYEMVAGTRPFDGDSPASLIGAILKDTPLPLATAERLVPPSLDRIVRRCLGKDPEDRWQSARDVMFELQSIDETTDVARSPMPRRRPIAAAALVALIVGAAAAWVIAKSAGARTSDLPVLEHAARISHDSLLSEWPSWSADGRLFAFSSNRSGNFEVYVRGVEGGQEINVTNHAGDDVQPALSPDGNSIAFVSTRSSRTGLIKIGTNTGFDTRTYGGDIWVVPTLGGQARRLAENGNFPAWDPNGRSIIYVAGPENHREIVRLPIDGGQATPVLSQAASHWELVRLRYAPDAHWITFETSEQQVLAMPASGGNPVVLLRGTSHVWDPSGRRVYYVVQEADNSTRIEAADVEENAGGLRLARVTVAGVTLGRVKDLAVASDRHRLLAVSSEESLNLTRIRMTDGGATVVGAEEQLSEGQVRDRYPAVSPEGRRIAVGSNRTDEEELWIVDVASRSWERVQMPPVANGWISQACWTHDARHLVVMRHTLGGLSGFWYLAVDGSSTVEILPPKPALAGSFACDFSPDDSRFVYARVVDGVSQLFTLEVASRHERQLTSSAGHKYAATWSPDGRWIAFSGNTGTTVQVWRVSADGGREQQLTTGYDRMMHPFYSRDGRWLYVQPNHHNIQRMPADGGALTPVTSFPESGLFLEEPTLSPDGRWLVYMHARGGSSLWLLTLGTR